MKLPESLELISSILWKIKTREDLVSVLEDLLTPSEIVEVWDRIRILKMLRDWLPQRQIAEELWISVTTVTRGNRVLKYERRTIDKYI